MGGTRGPDLARGPDFADPCKVDVMDLAAVDSFLQNAPNRIVHRIEIWTVRWQSSGLMKSGVSADSSATVSRAWWAGAMSCWKVKKLPETEQMASSIGK